MMPQALIPRRRRPYLPLDEELEAPAPLVFPRPARILSDPSPEPITRAPVAVSSMPPIDAGPPPLTTTDRRGRPRIMSGVSEPDRLTAERQLMDDLRNYEPKKRSRLRLIGMSALRGLAGGPGGAISGALWGAGASLLDPTIEDKRWQAEQIAQSRQRQQELLGEQRYGLQDELLRAQVAETQAQAEQRRNPRPRLVESVLPDGTQILVPEQQGVVTGRPRPDARTETVTLPDGRQIATNPEAAVGYYGQVEARGDRARERESTRRDESLTRTSQRQALLTEAETLRKQADNSDANATALDEHIKKLTEGMASFPEGGMSITRKDSSGNSTTEHVSRAAHQKQIDDLKTEQRRLREQAQGWRTQAASSQAKGEAIPSAPVEDPSIRSYANQFFRGDYRAAEAEIRRQRGQ